MSQPGPGLSTAVLLCYLACSAPILGSISDSVEVFIFLMAWIQHCFKLHFSKIKANTILHLGFGPCLLFALWHNMGLVADLDFAHQVLALSDLRCISWDWSMLIAFNLHLLVFLFTYLCSGIDNCADVAGELKAGNNHGFYAPSEDQMNTDYWLAKSTEPEDAAVLAYDIEVCP